MQFPDHRAGDQVALELGPDPARSFAALADEPHPAAGQPFDRGDADILGEAADDDDAFVEIEMHDAAHSGSLSGVDGCSPPPLPSARSRRRA